MIWKEETLNLKKKSKRNWVLSIGLFCNHKVTQSMQTNHKNYLIIVS